MVSYSDDRKYAYFDGLRFCRDDRTGYYLNATLHKRLHRYVYERVNGNIPNGYQVHHKDHDKGNNEPDNLELLTKSEHMKRHGEELTVEQRQWRRDNMCAKAIPAAREWHKTEAGREWHKNHYETTKDALVARVLRECKQCGRLFKAIKRGDNIFCSNACKSASRRRAGLDNVQRDCVICGAVFTANRYSSAKTCSRSCAQRMRHKTA